MALVKPYRKVFRENLMFSDEYIFDSLNCDSLSSYSHAFHLIDNDLKLIFDFISPNNNSFSVYSHRIYELFLRTCIEVENNFVSFLKAHNYTRAGNWNISSDYFKTNSYLKLNEYEIKLNIWENSPLIIKPFQEWSSTTFSAIPWYQDYNKVKHDRSLEFSKSNFRNLIYSVSGLTALLFAQFERDAFSLYESFGTSPRDGFYSCSGCMFEIKPPVWQPSEKYNFEWKSLKSDPNRFESLSF